MMRPRWLGLMAVLCWALSAAASGVPTHAAWPAPGGVGHETGDDDLSTANG